MTSIAPMPIYKTSLSMFSDAKQFDFTDAALGLRPNDYVAYAGIAGNGNAVLSASLNGLYYVDPTGNADQILKIALGIGHDGTNKADDITATLKVIGVGHKATAGNDTLAGYAGQAYKIDGGAGNDNIYGREKADVLVGGAGNDNINGGAGNDFIRGGAGKDVMTGGTGADRFDFDFASESTTKAFDTIRDFNHAQGDRIDLSTIDANSKSGGNQAFSFIGESAFGKVVGQLRYDAKTGHVLGDTNGDGIADFDVALANYKSIPTLVSTDFFL